MDVFEKAALFKKLHTYDQPLILPNPWDAGSARILSRLGFEALATTSAGLAFSLGRQDARGSLSRDCVLANAESIVLATDLPVSADLENGFGDSPEAVGETIQRAAEIGLAGGSIEDATGNASSPLYDFNHAVERIAAAAEAVKELGYPFMLVARAETYTCGGASLDDTVRRLQAYEAAGADVLYAPGLPDLEAIRLVCESVSKPVNVVMGLSGANYSVSELAEAGVKRISLGSSLARAAWSGFIAAALEARDEGTFGFAESAVSFAEINSWMNRDGE
ncbi:isocitrate lyase/phosphoenolpyruvate mutase family protein [Pseudomonas sp.]|uniref:isocitrate lyase/PEP mutase family protein n=1 Tax=Pseudomonas sp. TaxID=306 RepID=UPI0028A8CD1A|nr:isocitrate lyase/phosphoenolpyruvate mutase family protein [Pseudomonas sp.]